MKMVARILCLVAVVVMMSSLAACGPTECPECPECPTCPPCPGEPAAGGKTYSDLVVGFAQIGAESEWRTAETGSIKASAEELGVELKFSDAQQQQENQIKAVRSFIAQQVDVIGIAPVVESGWETVFQEAKDAGIPIIFVDRKAAVSDDLYTTFIGSDFVLEGYNACLEMSKLLGGEGKIIELQGTTGADPAIERKEGFEDCIAKEAPGLEILDSQTGDFTRAKGKEVMEAFLKAEGDRIDAVYAHNDDMALGAIQAIEEAGRKPGEDIIVVSIDGVRAAFEAMIEGKLNCTVECNPLLGPMAFDAVEALLAGEVLPKHTVVKDRVFDRSTAAAELPNRMY